MTKFRNGRLGPLDLVPQQWSDWVQAAEGCQNARPPRRRSLAERLPSRGGKSRASPPRGEFMHMNQRVYAYNRGTTWRSRPTVSRAAVLVLGTALRGDAGKVALGLAARATRRSRPHRRIPSQDTMHVLGAPLRII